MCAVRREIKILRLFMRHIWRTRQAAAPLALSGRAARAQEYVKTGELFDYIVEKGRLIEE
jgi:5'-AMP-activated protein kinase catalytic alpha subunit